VRPFHGRRARSRRPHRRSTAGVGRARDDAAAPGGAHPGGAPRPPDEPACRAVVCAARGGAAPAPPLHRARGQPRTATDTAGATAPDGGRVGPRAARTTTQRGGPTAKNQTRIAPQGRGPATPPGEEAPARSNPRRSVALPLGGPRRLSTGPSQGGCAAAAAAPPNGAQRSAAAAPVPKRASTTTRGGGGGTARFGRRRRSLAAHRAAVASSPARSGHSGGGHGGQSPPLEDRRRRCSRGAGGGRRNRHEGGGASRAPVGHTPGTKQVVGSAGDGPVPQGAALQLWSSNTHGTMKGKAPHPSVGVPCPMAWEAAICVSVCIGGSSRTPSVSCAPGQIQMSPHDPRDHPFQGGAQRVGGGGRHGHPLPACDVASRAQRASKTGRQRRLCIVLICVFCIYIQSILPDEHQSNSERIRCM